MLRMLSAAVLGLGWSVCTAFAARKSTTRSDETGYRRAASQAGRRERFASDFWQG